jgi:hypothetical protein
MNLTKLDSGTIKHKKKDSSDVEFSGSEGFDHFKYMTIKKSKLYTLQLGNDENATTALISVSSESNEKRQTFLGKMLSKNDEGKNEVVNYTRNVSGIIKRYNSASLWKFNLDNLTGIKNTDELPFLITSPVTGFLKNEKILYFLSWHLSKQMPCLRTTMAIIWPQLSLRKGHSLCGSEKILTILYRMQLPCFLE